jgi:hypothetical protein
MKPDNLALIIYAQFTDQYGNVTPTGGRKTSIVDFIVNNNGANFLNLDIIQ